MNRLNGHWLALSGIAILIAVLLLPMPSTWTLIVSVPLIVLFVTGLQPPPRWGGWAAVTMIPYLCIAVGEAIADPDNQPFNAVIVVCSLVVFFAAMYFVRKTGASLRRCATTRQFTCRGWL